MKPLKKKSGYALMGILLIAGCVLLLYFLHLYVTNPKTKEVAVKEVTEEEISVEETGMLSDDEAVLKYKSYPAGSVISTEELSLMNPYCLFYSEEIPDDVFEKMNGVSFHEEGVIRREDLRYVRLLHLDFNQETRIGELVVNAALADEVCDLFQNLYENSYEIESVLLIDDFAGDDHASMVANNTSCFNYRMVDDSDSLSNHAYGAAIDINPLYNPYVTNKGVSPIEGEAYADRETEFLHKICETDLCYQLFTEAGFKWGGSWNSVKDYQHFEKTSDLKISGTTNQNNLSKESTDTSLNENEKDTKKYVVVIDPGHGGENLGAEDYGPLEKDINLVTANAMYAELSLYDNVEVYMTRTSDTDLSLEERADFAKEKHADLLVSLHYNASDEHEKFGSEVLVSITPPYNALGYQLGVIQLEQMKSLGMNIRGIRCKTGKHGDYYGLFRSAVEKNITPVIFEHCYMDQSWDHNFAISSAMQHAFGVQDAVAVAKYLGLYSTSLNVDYRGYEKEDVDVNSVVPITAEEWE